jgi:preprotein translocase subunit YajC
MNETTLDILLILVIIGLVAFNFHLYRKERGEQKRAKEMERQSRRLESQQQNP